MARLHNSGQGVRREDYEGREGAARLRAHIRSDARRNELFIMEGLAKDYISILGPHLSVPPSFFVFQERNHIWAFVAWSGIVDFCLKYLGTAFASTESVPIPEYDWVA